MIWTGLLNKKFKGVTVVIAAITTGRGAFLDSKERDAAYRWGQSICVILLYLLRLSSTIQAILLSHISLALLCHGSKTAKPPTHANLTVLKDWTST